MTRSVRVRGVAAALVLTLFGAPAVQAQVAPAVGPSAAVAPLAAAAVGAAQVGELANRFVAPKTGPDRVKRPNGPNVFGTVPLPLGLQPTGMRWGKLMDAPLDQPALARLTGPAGGLGRAQQVAFVQAAVDQAVRNVAPAGTCADDGYWAPAGETLARGRGDCMDIAVAKMEALRFLGVPADDLYLTNGYLGGTRRSSTALLVRAGDEFWLLAPGSERPVRAGSAAAGFEPIMTFGAGSNWMHGRREASALRR